MPYFVMTCNGVYPSAAIDKSPEMDDAPWMSGIKLEGPTRQFAEPLVYTLDATRPGNIPAMIDDAAYPLMHNDLLEALQSVGVDNLQLFSAIIKDPTTGTDHSNYKAFNILGVVSKADMLKTAPYHLFRSAESVSTIVVDEVAKNEIERRGIPGMNFYDYEF